MRQRSLAAVLLALTVFAGGCGSQPEEQATPEETETPTAEEVPAEAETPTAQPFETPVVEEEPPLAVAPSGLISSTNPQERSREVQRTLDNTRQQQGDPFGILDVELSRPEGEAQVVETGLAGTADEAEAEAEAEEVASAGPPLPALPPQASGNLPEFDPENLEPVSNPVPRLPDLPPGLPFDRDGEGFSPPGVPMPDGSLPSPETSFPGETPSLPEEIPFSPPAPTADIARSVEITGVMQIDGEIVVIVRTPDVPFGRYVRVGDSIANGRVRIVRVERLQGEPIVILEENGIEVARGIGEPGISPLEPDGTATLVGNRGTRNPSKLGRS
ncbi:MAG: hypothetical protein J7641_19600 [Cyanobacteria bacterium SID2]|nr:hypothetical protein [Cyanobacteria bacterium SID2]MBP0004259.1 hypothetical protein [Cyanobacteria bacterium SBC]